jgi:mono/diheme cytochrome c family protein
MRRLAPFLGIAFVLAGCGSAGTVLPTAETVIGTVPTSTQGASVPKGDPAAGKTLYNANGCGGCHVFTPAGSHGTVGPDLDKLDQYAKQANQPLKPFTFESIKNPAAYVQPGYQNVMPNFGQTLKDKQIADLVAFLTAKG